jgi:hypothetical protein
MFAEASMTQVELDRLWQEHLKGNDAPGFIFGTLHDGSYPTITRDDFSEAAIRNGGIWKPVGTPQTWPLEN